LWAARLPPSVSTRNSGLSGEAATLCPLIVIGRVTTLGSPVPGRPLLFYRGSYAATEDAEPTPGVLDNLITWSSDWDRTDTWF